MTERSSGTRYSRKNSGGTPPSKPYPLSQQLPDRGSKASKCRPTKLIPPPTSATRRQRKQSFQVSSDKANSPSLSQRPADRGSKASKCRPTKLIPPPTSATRRQRKRSFQMSSDKANSPSHSQQLPDRGSKASKCRPSYTPKKFTLSIPKERRTSNDNNKIQRQTHPNPYINPNHHLPHHPQLQPDPCSSRTQRGHNPERLLPHHNPVTR